VAPSAEHKGVLEEAYESGRAAWPAISVSLERFAGMAREVAAVERVPDWAADFYIACGAALGIPQAVAAIDKDCLVSSTPRLRRLGASPDEVEEALQATRERLFVGPPPKIGAYGAAGPLKQWVQLVALRTAIDLRRSRRISREIVGTEIDADQRAHQADDPAIQLLKMTYRAEFEQALRAQIAELPARDRAILKLHLLEGVSIEQIATMRAVHRVTVARWVWRASETMLEGVRDYFLTHHGLIPEECDSLVNLVRSQLTLDWARVFEAPAQRAR
jgi:RNA polymerase sigma-70 factor (ECF subfamily)